MDAIALAPFPAARRAVPALSERMVSLGVAIRAATAADFPLLRRLFAGTRAPELIATLWTPAQKAAFCDSQFALQHADYLHRFPRGDFWVVTQARGGVVREVGRLSLDRKTRTWRVIDIIIDLDVRSQGIGGALIAWVQASAEAAGAQTVALSVATTNRTAQALYQRLGFVDIGEASPFHRALEWRYSTVTDLARLRG